MKETPAQSSLRQWTQGCPHAHMQITRNQAALLAWLVQTLQAKWIIELGVFTGYSTLTMAQAMPKGGCLYACDVDDQWLDIAVTHWQQAGVDDRIQFFHGFAIDKLQGWIDEGMEGKVDLIFIDADKRRYPDYYAMALKLLRVGGVIIMENILVNGKVVRGGENSPSAQIMRDFNDNIHRDSRVRPYALPLSDGMMLLTKG